jgi:S-DNA-T family DNA segregation ATPase FtsK/SpoIIIE
MMMMLKKKKTLERIIPGFSRSEDIRPFFIPKISELADKETLKRQFVSPIFGKSVKNDIVIENDRKYFGDIDKKYDAFRKNKKLTKEEEKKRYGDSYYEFNAISNADKKKILSGELDVADLTRRRPTDELVVDPLIETKEALASDEVSIDDFFAAVGAKKPEPEMDEMLHRNEYANDFQMEHEESLDSNRFGPIDEEDEDNVLFQENEVEREPMKSAKPILEPSIPENKPTSKLDKYREQVISNFDSYRLPSVSLLKKSPPKTDEAHEWIQANIDIINQTLIAFDIAGEVTNFTKGPTVTRYEISLGSGVPTKKITSISDNIQMNLAALSIRIEAPIPGKTTIGIEVPNKVRESVFFGDVVDNPRFLQSKDPLLLGIGLDIDANPVYTSIEAMPHGLVAGSTQSGKSVCIASIIASIIYKNRPDQVKLLLIDPKKVDLQQFAEIPHLITPIIDDSKIAIESLKWAVQEMERRYDVLKKFKSINVKDYLDRRINDPEFEAMPRIVIIVEEASDLLINGGPEVEEQILRLTQKSRAVGIHLILATQRPSADIIKGSIKANIPTRFAFRVPSSTDSMVVLDTTGAEKLLGQGDMLLSENGKIRRLQGAFLSPSEIEAVTDFVKDQAYPQYLFSHESLIKTSKANDDASELDELFAEIAKYVITEEKCSLNKITQEFGIGFNRANQIVSSLELYGIVSRNVGTKPREVLVNINKLNEILEKLGR